MIYNFKNHRPLPFASPGIWIAGLLLLMMAGRGWTQNLTEVEYYFDTDQGVGSGTSVPVTPPSSNLSNFNFSIDISGLNDGFHRLFVRAKDENEVWSFPNDRAFYKNTVTAPFFDLVKVEYFFNTDPGFGNGTNVPITPGPILSNLSFSIDITGLPSGFHHLFVRTKNQDGQWSFNSQRVFMKEYAAVPLPTIADAEYFFDTDPGFGQGVSIPVSPGGTNVTLDFTIDLTSIPDGFHQLYARVKDSEGNWSLASMRAFYKHTAIPADPLLTEIEYFLDTDPGFGQGTSVPITPNAPDVTTDFIVDLSSLSNGFHHLFVRARDTEGQWSLTSSHSFIKQPVAPGNLSITRIEYFLDNDPGFGLGTSIPITPSTDVSVSSHIIDITALSNGLHKLYVRAENEAGTWSLTSQWVFYKNNYNAALPNIVYGEYFFNTDPGLGLGTEIPVPGNSTQVDLSFTTDLSSLNEGSNKLYVRMKDASGRWSHSVIHQIFKKTLPQDLPDIVYAEYFVDSDPGMGSGIQIPVPNPSPDVTDLTFEVDLSQLIMGNHMLYLRTKDEYGKWSLTLLDQFCHTPQADFSANDVWLGNTTTFTDLSYLTDPNTQYYWDVNGDNVTDYTYDHGFTHTYPAAGTYNARLILVSPQGCPDTTIKQVSVYICQQPAALYVSDTTENSAILHWTPANMEPAWNIEYGISGFTPGTGTLISNVPNNYYLLTGLASNTSYDFYVQSACYTGSSSSWAGPGTFTTLEGAPCFNPTDGGAIAASQTICFGTVPAPFTSLTEASGYTGTLEYKWQSSVDNINFSDIPGSNSAGLAYGNALTATTWFRRLARVTCQPDWTGAAVSDTIQVSIDARNRYRTKTSGDWDNIATWEYFNGTTWVDAVDYPSSASITCPNPLASVRNGHTINVDAAVEFGNVTVDDGGILEVQNDVAFGITAGDTLTVNGTLIMHTTAVVNGAGHYWISASGTMHVGSGMGITVASAQGNIQVTGSRIYGSGAHYIYTGTTNQFTGDALVQNTPGNVSINTPGLVVTLSQAISISGNINIIAGTLDVNNHNITLGGNWSNTGIFIPGTATVYFNASVSVTVGISNFYNVVFAGSDSITATGSLTVYGDLTINHIFNAGSWTHYVYGNWINNGIFVYGTSTIQFMGTTSLYISVSTFYNIIFAGTGTYTAQGSLTIYGSITINNYFDAGSFTHYVYGNWVNNGTFVQGTSTIQFSGTGNIYIGASNFYNVIFACSGTVIASGQLTFYGNVTINNYFDAGTFVHYVYGNWINNGTFVYGTSTVNFVGTGTVYIGAGSFYNVIFSGTGTYIANGAISINGDITIITNFYAGSYTISVYGNWVNNGIFDYGTSTVEFIGSGNITITQNDFYNVIFGGTGVFIATGSLNFYGNVTINSTFDAGSYVHYIYGNWVNNGTFIYGTSTIYFSGTVNITIGTSEFFNVVFGGTGTVIATGSLTIYGDVTINNYFDAGSFVHYVYGNWYNNGIFVYGTSTITFVGTVNLFISTNEFYNVVFAGTGTYTATGSITFYGSVTINNYFDAGAFIHYVYGNWTVNGTFVYGTSTIQFMGSGNIFIGISNFYHIIFAGTGTVTATGSLTIWGDVTINNYFDAGSFVHYVYGNWINNGTFVYGTSTIWFSSTVNIYIGINEFYHVVFAGTGNYIATGSITFHGDVTINNYFDAGSYTHYVYGGWIVNGVFVYGTSTIHFMGTGISFVNGGSFYHVIFGGTGTVTATGSLTIYGNVSITGTFGGGSYIHYIYGNWTNTGTYAYGTSTIHFIGSGNILIGESDFYHIIFAGSGTIVATGSISVFGDFTINTYFDAGSYEHFIYGNWYNYGIFVYGTSTIHFAGTGNIFLNPEEFYHVIFGGTGTVTATGTLIFHGNVTINNYFNAGSFVHFVYGNWINNGTFVYGTSTIHFTGAGTILIGGSNFYHIIFGGTGTIAATGSLYVYGDVTINNYFDAGSYIHYVYGNWYNYGVFVYGTSTIHFSGSGNVYLGDYEFYHIIFGGTGTVVATGSLTIYGDVTINNYFDAGPYTHYIYGNWTNNGTFVYNTSTIRFVGSGNILIGAGNFYHVIFACSGTVTASGTLYFYGDVTILNHFDAASYDHYVYRNWVNNGTFVHGTSRIRFVGSQNLLLGTNNFYHVVFARTGTVTATGSLTIYGDLTITNHFDAGSFEHYLYGNWINNGLFVYGTSYVHFTGAVQQIIEGSNETGFYRFRVINPYGILLSRNATVHYELVLVEGIITTGTWVFIVMPSGTITGGSSTAYIYGRLRYGYNSIGSRIFPVGTATTYGPMVFNYVTLTGTSYVDVEYIGGTIPGIIPGNITSYADHYWIISQTGGINFTFTLTLNVSGFNPLGSVWMMRGDGVNIQTVSTTSPNYTNTTVWDEFGDFTLGEVFCANPSGLINRYITYTDAILDWEPGDSETEWNVEYGPAGFTPGTGTLLTNVSSRPLSITGLTPESYYEFYVQSRCSPVVHSSWVGPEPFSTFPKQLDAKVFLEGPYDGAKDVMQTDLRDQGLLPLTQPYQGSPWNYSGDEQVTTIPPGVVDWVLIEWRDASAPALANNSAYIWRKAAFLKNDGAIVDMDGSNLPWIGNPQLSGSLYILVHHRNHLSVISNFGAALLDDLYEYDFSDQLNKAYGGTTGYKQIGSSPLRFGMVSGDGDANGSISLNQDIDGVWNSDAGMKGYLPGDYNLNGHVQNQDKNDKLLPNTGKTSAVP